MPYWTKYHFFIAAILSCALFPKPNIYKKGVESYQKNDFAQAIKHFTDFYKKSPSGDSTLFFLYNCYNKIRDIDASIRILEELAKRKNSLELIYANLFNYYHQYNLYYKINQLLLNAPFSAVQKFDQRYPLTQKFCAELFTGATTNVPIKDPISYAVKKGYLKPAPDGKFYANDTIKLNNLILLLDSFLPPIHPERTFLIKNIGTDSYLYLPYLRLVSLGILQFDDNINPAANASLSQTVQAINVLKNKGFLK